jgi:hypothetical protein
MQDTVPRRADTGPAQGGIWRPTNRTRAGAPDRAVEILSPPTTGYDQAHKLVRYERHGVEKWWLVHPVIAGRAAPWRSTPSSRGAQRRGDPGVRGLLRPSASQ